LPSLRSKCFVSNDESGKVTAKRGKGDKEEKTPVPPTIKEIRGGYNEGILPTQLPPQEPIE
jgi:hypothetical protein